MNSDSFRNTTGCHDPNDGSRRPIGAGRVAPEWIGPDGTWPMPPGSGPCRTWPLEPHCGCLSPDAGAWDEDKTHAVEVATELLWRRTAGKFGLCHEIVRPCSARCAEAAPRGGVAWPDPHGTAPTPAAWGNNGSALPVCGCRSGRGCSCSSLSEILLPGPVHWEPISSPPNWTTPVRPPDRPPDIDTGGGYSDRYRLIVWVDGQTLREPGWPEDWRPGEPPPPVDYRPARGDYWLQGNRLVRTGGEVWPACQDMTAPIQARAQYPGEAQGSFAIEYWRGIPVPPGGRRAVSILACELWKACRGDDSCRLPRGVTEIQREGISYTLMDQQGDMLANLPEVSGWVQAVNPRQMYERSTVWSPDFPKVRSEWTSGGRPNTPYRGWR